VIISLNYWGIETWKFTHGYYPGDPTNRAYEDMRKELKKSDNLLIDGPVINTLLDETIQFNIGIHCSSNEFRQIEAFLPHEWEIEEISGIDRFVDEFEDIDGIIFNKELRELDYEISYFWDKKQDTDNFY
jgi:hypothetical protein